MATKTPLAPPTKPRKKPGPKPKAAPAPPPAPALTPTAIAQAELAQRVLAKRRLIPFTQRMNPRYDAGWVHRDIARRLERFSDDVAKGLSPRLMILMPPRHGKSELASRMFPAWHLGRHMDHEIIACSYNVSLAMSFSRKVKEVFNDPSYHSVFDARLNPDFQANEEWGLAGQRGGYVAAGVGGGITGKGAHILLIDDPIKNAEEADSADTREKLWDWYGSTAYTRLAPGGGVLVIQCMVGDTPVLMADGTEHHLNTLAVGDVIATYDRGSLATSRVMGLKSNGHDSVLKITMKSGRIVRANGRHPFLATIDGALKWIRARSLTTDHKIVALKDNEGSGKASPAPQTDAAPPLSAGGCVPPTTTNKSGPTGTAHQASTRSPAELHTSSTGTAFPSATTTPSSKSKVGSALSVAPHQSTALQTTGRVSSPSITATTPAKSVAYSATSATQGSDILELSPWHLPQPGTSDFTLDEIVSVEPGGIEEVFDLQVERTENFIANGLVSHNTWWHDDDLAGRLQVAMAEDPEADQFELVKYPAVAEADEYLNAETDLIEYDVPGLTQGADGVYTSSGPEPEHYSLIRSKGEPLHPERYDLVKLNRIKKTIPNRFWAALYQQNPVPDDGSYFTRDQFRTGPIPSLKFANVFIAWDFAISEKKQNDYTVGTVALQDADDMLTVVDQVRFKSGNALFIVEAILNLATKWHNPTMMVGFEDGQIFRALEHLLKKRMRERQFYLPTVTLKPITDKLARGRALQGRMQQAMVTFASGAPWYDSLKQEMLRFPAGVNDDQVDSLAWLAQMVVGREPPHRPKAPEMKSWKDKLSMTGAGSHMVA